VSNDALYNEYFEKYPFPLSSFQKWALEAIVQGNHILVTAHTGSGKTLPAEFAIEYFVKKGKKVIYTSPIKALSNQKFYEFTQKFPHISFGILTGDIKTNPEADVLIMTTEILLNTLYAKQQNQKCNNNTMFDMDFDNELACVVFDEVHYINDHDRGKIWEETIMSLPPHIQMVMLSATLDSPEKFALWCETKGNIDSKPDKTVYLATTYERVVPLTHYSFITCTQGIFKILKDKALEIEIMKTANSLHVVQDAKGVFSETNFNKIKKILGVFEDKNHFVKRQHVLNTVSKHMVENNMLPAICFVLSRKALEQCAKEVTTVLLEDDSKVPYIVKKECEQIIRKLPNHQEYLHLPEYINLIALLEKGIAIHHAGMMPVLREMVEMLFAKGYIKLLFATETFAVGINMPTKTVLFTDITKFDGSNVRPLFSHEYTQMSGRAGRRGIDTIGHVIHLTNLFRNKEKSVIQTIMSGRPQTLTSKFKVSYNLILNLISIGETDYTHYTQRSMVRTDIDNEMKHIYDQMVKLQKDQEQLSLTLENCKTPVEKVEEFVELTKKRLTSVNKKRKEIDRELTKITSQYSNIEKDAIIVSKYNFKCDEISKLNDELVATEATLKTDVTKVLNLLLKEGYVTSDNELYGLTLKGQLATYFREIHCLVFADLVFSCSIETLSAKELVGVLSCFTNVSVPDEKKSVIPNSKRKSVEIFTLQLFEKYRNMADLELANKIDTGMDYSMHFDLIDYCIEWCECENDIDCKRLLQTIYIEKEVFLGEFIKAILKINNICCEMEKVAEFTGNIAFLSVLKQVPLMTLKYVATNQSLYV